MILLRYQRSLLFSSYFREEKYGLAMKQYKMVEKVFPLIFHRASTIII